MRSSYAAIITCLGLESLVPECRGAQALLGRVRVKRPAACLWTVMEPCQAASILELLSADEGRWALNELARAAEFMGPLRGFPSADNPGALR